MGFSLLFLIHVAAAAATIHFDKNLIPKIDAALPVLSLGSPSKIPTDLFNEFVYASSPNVTFRTDPKTKSQLGYDGDILVSFVNATSGITKIFPNLHDLKPVKEIDITLAYKHVQNRDMFPKDDTKFQIVIGARMLGSTYNKIDKPTPPAMYLAHAVVQRNISTGDQDMPVCGPGSQASFGFGADGQVHSLSYRWNTAIFTTKSVKAYPIDCIYQSILEQLKSYAQTGPLQVNGVDVCYYDSGLKYIQPVYRFWATLNTTSLNPQNKTSPARVFGYLPIGAASLEKVPSLNDSEKGPMPSEPNQLPVSEPFTPKPNQKPIGGSGLPTINIGRYVVRDDSAQWVTNANNFLTNIRSAPFFFSSLANFVDKQYYWAEPRLFTSEKDSFINSVHIAEVEVHGNWHLFSTEKNCCDLVQLSDIPSSGYGGGARGTLAYWILHSCEVIPTTDDYSVADQHLAWDSWWPVFNGLHAAVGFRTEMWIGDDVIPTFAFYLSLGASYVTAWLTTVHDDLNAYRTGGKDQLYPDGNRNINEPMGRAAAIFVTGHGNDNVLKLENLGRPGSLTQMWYAN